MMSWSLRKAIGGRGIFAALVTLTMLAAPARAQERNFRVTTFYKIQPGRVGDFQAAVKEYNAVLMKANYDKPYSVWLSQSGDREYVLVTYHTNLAELDTPRGGDPKLKEQQTDLVRIAGRINQCAQDIRRSIGEIQKALTQPPSRDIPTMVSVLRVQVHPAKVDEYLAILKADLFPAVQKAGMKTYAVARTRYGGSRGEIVSSMGIDKWADLDGPPALEKAMGSEAYQKYLGKVRPLTQSAEYNVYRYQPELSYQPNVAISSNR